MRKVMSILSALVLMLSITACGEKEMTDEEAWNEYAGHYDLYSFSTSEGESFSNESVVRMEFDQEMYLDLNEDGTGELYLAGQPVALTWDATSMTPTSSWSYTSFVTGSGAASYAAQDGYVMVYFPDKSIFVFKDPDSTSELSDDPADEETEGTSIIVNVDSDAEGTDATVTVSGDGEDVVYLTYSAERMTETVDGETTETTNPDGYELVLYSDGTGEITLDGINYAMVWGDGIITTVADECDYTYEATETEVIVQVADGVEVSFVQD